MVATYEDGRPPPPPVMLVQELHTHVIAG
ncbi:hypothetical protein DFAR_1770008 [Desulfarculales bacterium]